MEEINLTNPIEKTLSEKLSFAVDNSMDGVALLDPEGKYYYLNEVHLSMFGYQSDKELIGKTWQFIYGQEEIDRISQYLFPLLMANGKWSGETLGKSKTGEPVYQEISLTAMPDGGLICICRDIAQKKKNLLQLEIYERILKHSSLMAIQTNVNREIEWVNDAFTKGTGYTLQEAIGKNPSKLLDGKDTDPATVDYITKQISKGEVFSCEVVNYNKSGEPYWISINGQPLYSDKGEIEHFFAIQEDITVRKVTEKKMKENSLRLQYAMDAANGALWEWDIVNNTVFYSAQWKAILGYKEDELSNDFKEWESRVHAEDIERVVQSINDYLEGKTDGYKSYTRILH
ncbi:MAG: PAS domain S-box protein, partial [Ferruginibacter sp.]